jgi:hypothetical protein
MVQFCLTEEHGLDALTIVLRGLAASQDMKYEEGSTRLHQGTTLLTEAIGNRVGDEQFLIFVNRPDGVGLGATNLGAGSSEVAVGFTAGSAPDYAQRFSSIVAERLAQYWRLGTVPSGRGALPTETCGKH